MYIFWKTLFYTLLAVIIFLGAYIGFLIFNSGKVKTTFSEHEMRHVLERSELPSANIEAIVDGYEYYLIGGDYEEKYCLQLRSNLDLDETWVSVEALQPEVREIVQSMTRMSSGQACLQGLLSQSRIKLIFADYLPNGEVNRETGSISVYVPDTGRLLFYAHKM